MPRRSVWLLFSLLLAMVCGGIGIGIASRIQFACGSAKLAASDGIVTRLYCVSYFPRGGEKFLLVRNPPSRTGDDVSVDEAQAAVAAVDLRLPVGVAGGCYLRRGVDTAPVCEPVAAGAVSHRSVLTTVDDDQRPYLLLGGVGVLWAVVMMWLLRAALSASAARRLARTDLEGGGRTSIRI